jgi:hypothetical protein
VKIVTREQFMEYPAETVFSTYAPCWFGLLTIKGATINSNGKNIDWYEQQIADAIDASSSDQFSDMLFIAQEAGDSLPMDFDCQGRDGLFDEKQLYAVWEPQDVAALVNRLQRCLALQGSENAPRQGGKQCT